MAIRTRSREVQDYLKKIDGEISITKLVERLEKDGIMSHAIAWKAIYEAVNSGLIIKRDKERGKIKMVYLTAHAKYEELEKSYFDKMEKLLKQFNESFDLFKKMYSGLTLDEKAYGMEGYFQFHVHFHMVVNSLYQKFEKTKQWSTLLHEVRSRHDSLNQLMSSGSEKEHAMISTHIMEGRLMYLDETIKKLMSF